MLNIKHTTEEQATLTATANITARLLMNHGLPAVVHPDNV